MNPSKLSLGLKFSVAVTLLIVLMMVGVATLIISYQKESLRQNTSESNLAMTRNLAHDAEGPLLIFDPLRLSELVATVRDATSCAYAMIADREGSVVAHTRRALLGAGLSAESSPELIRTLASGTESVREYRVEQELIKEFAVPIRIGNETIGVAVVAYSVRSLDAAIEERLAKLKRYIYLITGIMLLAGIGGAVGVSRLLIKPLTRLKETMLDVQTGNLGVEVENPGVVRCWERLGCDRKDCPSYGKMRCWAIAGTFCHDRVQGAFAQKIGDCRKCVVYRESCGDEIHELVEVFNQMVKDLRFNLSELEKANMEKARMERLSALGEMAATVAHETKNPLNAIRLATSYLKDNFQGELLTEFLTIIEQEVLRLNDITSGFLGFSKPAPLKVKPCDINAIVKSAVELIRQEATERNLEVVLLTDEHIPPVPCDFSQLKQALLNILINAMDASAAGGAITVVTEAGGAQGRMKIAVRDSGKGIRPEDVANIFKPFYTTKTRGSGLGLAIVERIVKEHAGDISVESAAGKGAQFTITLPVEHAGTEHPGR
jgi:signal transduction histidine kinase